MKPHKSVNPTLVVHGGAGLLDRSKYPPERTILYKQAMRDALLAGQKILDEGGNALDAAVAAVVVLEDCPLFNSGRGAVFNIAGKHELEASVAVSQPPQNSSLPASRRGVAVTLIKHVKNPIRLARELYLDEQACPHPFVSGEDAERIAKEKQLEMVDVHYFDTEERWEEHRRGLGVPVDEKASRGAEPPAYSPPSSALPYLPKGTVGAVALDKNGMLACATSTGGKTNKNVGRIGDTPSMGSGFIATSWQEKKTILQRLGLKPRSASGRRGVAISGTGDGDYFIRNSATATVAHRMELRGHSVERAAKHTVEHLRTQGGEGGMIALDESGNYAIPLNCNGMFRGVIDSRNREARVAMWADDKLEVVP